MTDGSAWFIETDTEGLEQGDIFFELPVVSAMVDEEALEAISRGEEPEQRAEVKLIDAILMTQSCDLAKSEIDSVIVCPIWTITESGLGKDKLNSIIKGYRPGWHILNRCDDPNLDFQLVEFQRIYSAPKATLQSRARSGQPRPRLVSPYKEHLSQSFARFFMRVGLPSGIRAF